MKLIQLNKATFCPRAIIWKFIHFFANLIFHVTITFFIKIIGYDLSNNQE